MDRLPAHHSLDPVRRPDGVHPALLRAPGRAGETGRASMVVPGRLELPASRMSSERSTAELRDEFAFSGGMSWIRTNVGFPA